MVQDLELSGYKPYTEVLAQRSMRGEHRRAYVLSLPLYLIGTYLPVPDPDQPFPGNRRVNKRHAEKFAEYWTENSDWVTPPLLIDTTAPLHEDFDAKFQAGGVEFGVLRIRQNSASSFDILDGQHRILGWKLAGEHIAEQLKSYRGNLQRAKELQDLDTQRIWNDRIAKTQAVEKRYTSEYVTVEILQGLDEDDHRQAFNDIATNALGITKSVTVSFDRRSMINRVAIDAATGIELLDGQVDWEKDRVAGRNEHLISGRNLADIVRHVALGIQGRMTRRRELEMSESAVSGLVDRYFEALVECFPQLQDLQDGKFDAVDMREGSMILSPTILRVLAGAFHNLAVDFSDEKFPRLDAAGYQRVKELFKSLSGHMAFPLHEGWYETGYFAERTSKAPMSRAQDLTGLTTTLTAWGEAGDIFIDVE